MSVYFGGSRSLYHSVTLVQVVHSVLASGQAVHVGCQFGADAHVIQAASHTHSSLFVFAVASSWQAAPRHVQLAQFAGASVSFAAGGQSAPMRARFLLRSIAAFQGCSQAIFFQPGPGSLAVARECAKSGLPVFAFGSQPAPIPSQSGTWVASQFMGFSCWQWQPTASQPVLF